MLPAAFAVIVAVPAFLPVTTPFFTVAMLLLLLDQIIVLFVASVGVTTAVNVTWSPMQIVFLDGVTTTFVGSTFVVAVVAVELEVPVTVTLQVADNLYPSGAPVGFAVAVSVAVPALFAFTKILFFVFVVILATLESLVVNDTVMALLELLGETIPLNVLDVPTFMLISFTCFVADLLGSVNLTDVTAA